MEHAGKDNKSHMPKHVLQSGHPSVSPNDFRILQKGYNNNKVKRKIGSPTDQKTPTFVEPRS